MPAASFGNNVKGDLPPVAVLMTVYNRQPLMERALKSLQPELSLLDIIIVDDSSNPPIDITHFSTFPIHLIRLPKNSGAMAASNAGLEYIYSRNYAFIARLDSDDEAINQRFRKQLDFLTTHPEIGLVASHFHIVSPEGKYLRDSMRPLTDVQIRKGMHLGCLLHHSTWMMRAEVARKVGFYNTSFIAAGDYEFAMRVLAVTKVWNLAEPLIRYEEGSPASLTHSRRVTQAVNALKVKLRWFDPLNIYSYLGLGVSVFDITNILPFMLKSRKMLMRLLLGNVASGEPEA